MIENTMDIATKTCSICGKEFVPAPMHVYKLLKVTKGKQKVIWQCSYSCQTKALAKSKKKKCKGRRK